MIHINKVLASALNGRSSPDASSNANIVWAGGILRNDILVCDAQTGSWFRVKALVRNGANVAMPAPEVWASAGATYTFQARLASFQAAVDLSALIVKATLPVTFVLSDGSSTATYSGQSAIDLTRQ